MSRSRKRKLARHPLLSHEHNSRARSLAPAVAGAVCAALSPGWALAQEAGALEEVVVTAQKRSESLQDVPLSIQAIGTQRLEELSVKSFDDYVRFLPSVNFQTGAPGFASVYMRGIASGENSNHSGPLPSVGIYLDEQPITTIQGALDVHIYDIARVEALAGPQGTLYGASSQAGTIRIITNKPDPEAFDAGFSVEGNMVSKGDLGYVGEGFVNLPVGERAAIRLVGFAKRDAGFIDNVPGTRTYPVSGVTINNNDLVEEDYNAVDTYGARAALRIDLSDNWTITPALMAQQTKAGGSFSYNPALGDMRVSRFLPESLEDRWAQLALTVEGKIANLNVVYAGAYLKRDADTLADYSDYSFFYDVNYGSGAYIYDNAGNVIEPTQGTIGKDGYKRQSHELRFSTAGEGRVRAVGGLFYQRQVHDILQNYYIRNFSDFFAVTGYPDTIWLTNQQRVDRDYAAFGEVTFDATDKLSLTAGVRYFESRNSLIGFFGYSRNFSGRTGEARCETAPTVGGGINGGPCVNLDKEVEEDGWTPRVNATYKLDDDKLVYLTYSEGFRPGGINRRGTLPPYNADFLTNYEFGWKTTWAANTLRFNGALFFLKWDDIQFSYLGLNGLTEIRNAGNAEVRGLEIDLSWAATDNLTITGGFALTDTELTSNYCVDQSQSCPPPNGPPDAPAGTQLPVTPKFKGNLTARYGFPLGGMDGHVQLAAVYQGSNWADLQTADREPLGQLAAYTTADFALGASADNYEYEFFIQNLFDKRGEVTFATQCAINGFDGNTLCGNQPYTIPNRPRLIGFRYTQKF